MLNDYFGYKNIDGVYWTLQAELKFYACVFLLIVFDVFKHFRIWLSLWLSITVLYLLMNQPFFMGWFITPYYSSFFIAGVGFYLLQKESINKYNIFILVSSLIISSIYIFNGVDEFIRNPSYLSRYVAVILIFLCFILFYLLVTNRINVTKRKFYMTLGGMTYPLYLIHNVAGQTIIGHLKEFVNESVAIFCVILFILMISYFINNFIEIKYATPLKIRLIKMLSCYKLQRK